MAFIKAWLASRSAAGGPRWNVERGLAPSLHGSETAMLPLPAFDYLERRRGGSVLVELLQRVVLQGRHFRMIRKKALASDAAICGWPLPGGRFNRSMQQGG